MTITFLLVEFLNRSSSMHNLRQNDLVVIY